MNRAKGVDYFGRGHWITPIQERISLAARRRMYEIWRGHAGDLRGKRVLDVGATPDCERLDSNCMIPWMLADGLQLTLYSPEEISDLAAVYRDVRVAEPSKDGKLPFEDGEFDWVTSSAVLEHVGSREQQTEFLRECRRVGKGLFLTTPNRGHWLEFHTKLPLIHWLPKPWHRKALSLLGKGFWSQESNLNLLRMRELRAMGGRVYAHGELEVRSVWALGMPSNLVLIARSAV